MEVRVKVDGNDYRVFSPNGTIRIDTGEQKGAQLPMDLSSIKEGNVTALALIEYGSSKNSLEEFASKEGPLTAINYVDQSNVSVQQASYDKAKKSILVTIRNNGNQPAYVFTRMGLMMGGAPANITGPATNSIDPGSLLVVEFPLQLSDADLAANKEVTVYLDYGARQGFLNMHGQYPISLSEAGGTTTGFPLLLIIGAAAVIILVAVVAFFLMRKKQQQK